LQALQNADVDTLIIKGYQVGSSIYEQPGLRPYGDFDMLVPTHQLDTADIVLKSIGYKPELEGETEAYWQKHHHLPPYVHEAWLTVEVHRTLARNIHFDLDAIWKASVPFDVQGVITRALCTEHQLIFLCAHAVHSHLFNMGLKPMCDIHELLTTTDIDWETVIKTADDWDCTAHLYIVLRMVNYLFGWALPEIAERQLRDEYFKEEYISYSLGNLIYTERGKSNVAQVKDRIGIHAKIQFLLHTLLPTQEKIRKTFLLPDETPVLWRYYPRWWWKLLQHAPGLNQRIIQDNIRRDMQLWLKSDSIHE
jgi:hypothetical protein